VREALAVVGIAFTVTLPWWASAVVAALVTFALLRWKLRQDAEPQRARRS
jgi:hypothetical protein